LADFLLKSPRKTFAEALAPIPDVGTEADFQRVVDAANVADGFN